MATPKNYRRGTHRVIDPAATVDRVRRVMPVLGITRVANVTGLDRIGIPVVMVCRPNSRSLAVCQGKGLDLVAAKASGMMEAAEHFHAERITLPVKLARYNDLRFGHPVVDPDTLPKGTGRTFHGDLRLPWISGHDLMSGEAVWLPYDLVHLDLTLPLPANSGCFPLDSNGLGAGNHPLEALGQGICELVERDAVTLWWQSREKDRQQARLDLSTVDDAGCGEILERYERAEVDVVVWDITSDLELPAFYCRIFDRTENLFHPLYRAAGMGCHLTREVALMRALTEAAQSRLTMISGARDDLGRRDYERALDPRVVEEARAELASGVATRRFEDVPSWPCDTFEEDLETLLKRLRAVGISRLLAVDLTISGLDLAVVRVVIPGLEGLSWLPGYRPGPRLKAHLLRSAP